MTGNSTSPTRRRFLNIATASSLFLCITCIALALLSYSTSVTIGLASSHWSDNSWYHSGYILGINDGRFILNCGHTTVPMYTVDSSNWNSLTPDAQQRFIDFRNQRPERAGWYFEANPIENHDNSLKNSLIDFHWLHLAGADVNTYITLPAWFPILLFALLPARRLDKRPRIDKQPLPA